MRLLITDAIWAKIEPILKQIKHPAGSPPPLSGRMFFEAVLYQARSGVPWLDLPRDFGYWSAVYHPPRHAAGGGKKTVLKPPRLWAALG